MFVMGFMLLVITGFTSLVPEADIFACPAQCVIPDFTSEQYEAAPIAIMVLNIAFLTWGYGIALVIFGAPQALWRLIKRPCPHWAQCGSVCFKGDNLVLRILKSDSFKVGFSSAFFGLGLYELVRDRLHGNSIIAGSENEMSFGQLLAMALLSLPLLSALEFYLGSSGNSAANRYTEQRKRGSNEEVEESIPGLRDVHRASSAKLAREQD